MRRSPGRAIGAVAVERQARTRARAGGGPSSPAARPARRGRRRPPRPRRASRARRPASSPTPSGTRASASPCAARIAVRRRRRRRPTCSARPAVDLARAPPRAAILAAWSAASSPPAVAVRAGRRLLARGRRGRPRVRRRHGAGHARRRRPARRTRTSRRGCCLEIIGAALAEAGARLEDVVRTRIYVTDAERLRRGRPRARRGLRRDPPRLDRGRRRGLLDPRWHVEIEADAVLAREADLSRARSPARASSPGGSVLDHTFGQGDPYTLGVEEEYMLLDGETFDLVQHIDTVLAGGRRPRARAAHQRRS